VRQLILIVSAFVCFAVASPIAYSDDPPKSSAKSQTGAASTGKKQEPSMKELAAMVKKPTTPFDIVRNIKFALDHQLFIRDDFYANQIFNHFFAATEIYTAKLPSTETGSLRMTGQALAIETTIDPPMQVGSTKLVLTRFGLSFNRVVDRDGTISASIDFYTRAPEIAPIHFADVIDLFGPGWKYVAPPETFDGAPSGIHVKYPNGKFVFDSDKNLTNLSFSQISKGEK
jgi:hypothetical protein